jgi:hypothetical protein
MEVKSLLNRCYSLGATFSLMNNSVRVQAPHPLPDEILNELRQSKSEVIKELRYELQKSARCWMLEEWRRISIPQWRRILQGSIRSGDKEREEYARWMLREILEDQDYQP